MMKWALDSAKIPRIAIWLVKVSRSWVQSAAELIMLSITVTRRL